MESFGAKLRSSAAVATSKSKEMSGSTGPPTDATNVDERRRITYSREFLLSLSGSEAAGRGNIDASVLRMRELEDLGTPLHQTVEQPPVSVKSHLCRTTEAHGDGQLGQTVCGSSFKTMLCWRFTDGLCAFGGRCRYAHGEHELNSAGCLFGEGCHSRDSDQQAVPKMNPSLEASAANPRMASPTSFGASATTKISFDAFLTGAIIGWRGATIEQIRQVTGAKLAIRDHESDTSLKNIELNGTFDQIKNAGTMVMELIASVGDNAPSPARGSQHDGIPGSKYKTMLCEYFTRGFCSSGDRCRFAHGEDELRNLGPTGDDAFLKGANIGWRGASMKQIYGVTRAKLVIRDHESDTSLKNIELKGTFDQIKNAGTMVMEPIASIGDNAPSSAKKPARGSQHDGISGSKYKTRLCEYFTRGFCSSGDRCCFAHGEDELRNSGPTDVDDSNFWAHDEFLSRKGGW